ncbi:MAG TPA: formimidoylglutamate deiminase [Ramlibacter sp.]|nr:formimidoylglutamate deiminase [Ramlibacter sp.]
MPAEGHRYLAPAAWVNGAWAMDVLLEAGEDGRWRRILAGAVGESRQGATLLAGPVLPGLVNAHSHAFQRAMAGLTERSHGGDDDFWHWRDRMYGVALRITPGQLEAVAAFLYAELLRAGYTQVCEFHYLHNDPQGRPYADPAEMSLALVRAASQAGIGLTLLPTLYMRSGFGAQGLRDEQRRFASTPQSVSRIMQSVTRQAGTADSRVNVGLALHSLRAVGRDALREAVAAAARDMPIHLHLAEQRREVEDCISRHNRSPVAWLLDQVALDDRWNLVHATQCTRGELESLRNQGASIVLCPTTEANLGDGIFDLAGWLGQSGNWSVGSDSHVTRSWTEELRLLEYSQRLGQRRRNVAAHAAVSESTAAALFQGALAGGTAAAGVALGGLKPGQRADFVVIDTNSPALLGVPEDHWLDALVFSSPHDGFAEVYVAGRPVPPVDPAVTARMREAMRTLWP